MSKHRLAALAIPVVGGIAAVAAATLVIAALEGVPGVPNASAVYLVAVAAVAIAGGTGGAVFTAVLSVLVYDFLFTDPLHTLLVADPGEWLNLVLLLFVAVTVGQLAALQRRRAEVAVAREREARALFAVTRLLATRDATDDVLPAIAAALAREGGMDRAWISLGADDATERPVADTGDGSPIRRSGAHAVLQRPPGEGTPTWTQVRDPIAAPQPGAAAERRYRVRLEVGGRPVGSIWCTRPAEDGAPDAATTRLLAVTADQVAQAIAHDRLVAEAQRAEIARQSDSLKSALLESVSHDLRTPLASIRAYAGTLMDEEVTLAPDEIRASAGAIDREAQRLNRLVANLLDLGRIEGGALRAAREVLDMEDVVSLAVAQVAPRAGARHLEVAVPDDVAIVADGVLLEQALINLLENAVRHTPDGTTVRITTTRPVPEFVRLTVEDSGPGVPREALPRLFEKFYRPPGRASGARGGTGIGLAVVRGLVEALGGRAAARTSDLGGLAIDLDLPAAATTTTVDGSRAVVVPVEPAVAAEGEAGPMPEALPAPAPGSR